MMVPTQTSVRGRVGMLGFAVLSPESRCLLSTGQHRAQLSLGLRGQVPQATDVKGRHHPVSSMPSHHQHFPGRELLGFGRGSFFVSKTGLSRSSGMAVWFR